MNLKNFKLNLSNRNKDLIPQVLTVFLLILVIIYFTINAQDNMGNRGISFGFGFLSQESSFDITFSLIDYDGSHSYARAFLVGLLNTILVSSIGIFFATLLGVTVGIGRLSQNYLIAKAAEWYVEIFRNIPLILQIFFWYFAALRALPLTVDSINFYDISFLNVKGWYVPRFIWTNFSIFFYSIVVAIISIIFFSKYARKQRDELGKQLPTFYVSLSILIGLPLLTFLIGGVSLTFEIPKIEQLSTTVYVYKGGVSIIPELISLALALSMYTATFIAENVRAGILGVNKGQKEAAASIGLTKAQILKLVVMPQALRIIIPPTTNQYLNLTKNSSLAAAIAYPDIVLVFAGTALMQTGRAIEIISITMLTYLSLSLSISIFMNWYNKKIAIKEK
ncbi:MAG: amino acid ABC transporter permease [Pelagibacteraceae bacterium]|mgnify:CR=1 FL=1|nr:amino acid ABC transporter permease [Pelagibacteraceae bacterium]|tara:strand:+ start:112 stop:1290 length:1179 start_codon:yes stop_codon:yes gene_type:complete